MNEIKPIGDISGSIPDPSKTSQKGEASFEDAIKNALRETAEIKTEAEQAIRAFAAGEVQDIHTVVIAMQKADMSLQTLMQVRNKLLTAYQEVMRMQV